MPEYLIIGADAAGLSAAIQIRRKHKDASIKVINRGKIISYGACGIPYVISGDIDSSRRLIGYTPESFEAERRIKVEIEKEAAGIFPEEHEVEVRNLTTGERYREKYGKLLIGTGADPRKLPFLDYEEEGIFNLHNIEDLDQILRYMEKRRPQKAAVIGAGNIGLELVEALHRRALEFYIFEVLEIPVANWPPLIQKAVVAKMEEKDIQFYPKTFIKSVEKEGERFSVKTESKEYLVDIVFSVVGVKPATDFCSDKLHKLDNGAILIDRMGKTSEQDIYAAGDCASVYHRILKKDVFFPLGTTANKQGRVAGLNMAGENIAFPGIVGTQIFKFFELSLAKTGLSLEEAESEGIEAEAYSAMRRDKPGYYPGSAKAHVEVVCEKGTGKIIGSCAVTEGNAIQFIDPAVVAITGELTVKDLAWLDAAYAPPYAPVWNALVSAAFKGFFKGSSLNI